MHKVYLCTKYTYVQSIHVLNTYVLIIFLLYTSNNTRYVAFGYMDVKLCNEAEM